MDKVIKVHCIGRNHVNKVNCLLGDDLREKYDFVTPEITGEAIINSNTTNQVFEKSFIGLPKNEVEKIFELASKLEANEKREYNFYIYEDGSVKIGYKMLKIKNNLVELKKLYEEFENRIHCNIIQITTEEEAEAESIIVGDADSPLQVEIKGDTLTILNQWERLRHLNGDTYKLGEFNGIEFRSEACPSLYYSKDNQIYIRGCNRSKDNRPFCIESTPTATIIEAIEDFNMFHSKRMTLKDLIQHQEGYVEDYVDLMNATPIGQYYYNKDQYDIASIIAFAELNCPKDPIGTIRKALEALEKDFPQLS